MKNVIKKVFDKVQFADTVKAITDKGMEKLAASAGNPRKAK